MIRLSEIKLENNIISCIVTTVETHPQVFRVAYNLTTEEVVENTSVEMDINVGMAVWKLIKLHEEYGANLPDFAVSAWYKKRSWI